MKFDTKIAAIVRDDLATWQKLNVTAFTISGIAGTNNEVIGENYEDGSGNLYLPMFKEPVFVFGADAETIKKVYNRAQTRGVQFSIFTEELFSTNNDIDNRAAVKSINSEELKIVGMAMRAEKKIIDKIFAGVSWHK
jgi:hypothetical protein